MALEASHIRFAVDIKDKLDIKDIEKYISGSIYPDSRYITKVERKLTHPLRFLEKDYSFQSDFEKGLYSHILYDTLLKEYTLKTLQGEFNEIISDKDKETDLWVRFTALKILQDIDDIKKFTLQRYLPYLEYVENLNGENLKDLLAYNKYIQKMYVDPQKISIQTYFDMWQFFGIEKSLVERIRIQVEIYKKDLEINEFIKHVYDNTVNSWNKNQMK